MYKEKLETFQNFLLHDKDISEALVELRLEKGDGVFWKDRNCLHGRNSFKAKNNSDRFFWKCAIDVGIHDDNF